MLWVRVMQARLNEKIRRAKAATKRRTRTHFSSLLHHTRRTMMAVYLRRRASLVTQRGIIQIEYDYGVCKRDRWSHQTTGTALDYCTETDTFLDEEHLGSKILVDGTEEQETNTKGGRPSWWNYRVRLRMIWVALWLTVQAHHRSWKLHPILSHFHHYLYNWFCNGGTFLRKFGSRGLGMCVCCRSTTFHD